MLEIGTSNGEGPKCAKDIFINYISDTGKVFDLKSIVHSVDIRLRTDDIVSADVTIFPSQIELSTPDIRFIEGKTNKGIKKITFVMEDNTEFIIKG